VDDFFDKTACLNCGGELAGAYCHGCGQKKARRIVLRAGRMTVGLATGGQDAVAPALSYRGGVLDLAHPVIMGVVNVTPDSFSDGGAFLDADRAVAHGRRLAEEGAAILDVGGESTRPGAAAVPVAEELRRVLPVVCALAQDGHLVSIDTRKAEVARRAVEAGAVIVNDVSGLRDQALREVIAESRAGCVVMHMRGAPATMQAGPVYDDVVDEVMAYLAAQLGLAVEAGIAPEAIALDPGIGFGKTLEHNLSLLRGIPSLLALGRPVVIGASRKSFLGLLTGQRDPRDRVAAGLAATLFSADRGAHILRTHDVQETRDALRVREVLVDIGAQVR
jgi:dihydropteroate synthase